MNHNQFYCETLRRQIRRKKPSAARWLAPLLPIVAVLAWQHPGYSVFAAAGLASIWTLWDTFR